MVKVCIPARLVPAVLGVLSMIPCREKGVRVNFDERGNAIIQAISAFGVFIMLVVVIFFVCQTLFNALPINNSSPFRDRLTACRFVGPSRGILREHIFDVHSDRPDHRLCGLRHSYCRCAPRDSVHVGRPGWSDDGP